jgi:hypothetical protein
MRSKADRFSDSITKPRDFIVKSKTYPIVTYLQERYCAKEEAV